MTCTIVCDVLGEQNNGTTIAAMNLIRTLKKKGHKVNVLCGDESRRGEEGFFVVKNLNLGPLNSYVAKNGVQIAKPDKKVIAAALADADVMHVMTPFWLSTAAVKVAKKMNIPITAGFHCQAENFTNHIFMMNFPFANHLTYRIFYHSVYRHCRAIHFPTQFVCDVFEKEVGPTPHHIISNGVSGDFTPREGKKPAEFEGKFVILFTGRYSKEKSHKVLIDAVKKSRFEKDIQLVFAGDGPLKENLMKRAKGLSNPPLFRFFSRSEMLSVLAFADLYVHPAEIELESIACLEAIAAGKVPLVADSARAATPHFALSEENKFRCNDSSSLAEKIDFWISNPEKLCEMQKKYRGFAKQFDFDACMDRMEEMLLGVIDKAKQ